LPLLKIEIQTEDNKTLVHQGWSQLRLVAQNQGFGPAQMVSVRVTEKERFEGLITRTRKIARVPAGSSETWTVDVRPLEFGDTVPLRLSLDYQDQMGQSYSNELTLYLAVAHLKSDQHPVQHVTVQVGGVHISNVVNSRLDLGDITASVQAGGDIIGNI
ncbi:MAG TPA: hypothetical protein P5526_32415, partial [Anaerolineae bacterium]|nr:hypothetical protein [Anaerolineae bacterium]